jgi:hypothetical protein
MSRCGAVRGRPYAVRVRNGRIWTAVIALTVGLTLAGCAKTVTGHGAAAEGVGPTTLPTSPPSATESPDPSATSTSTGINLPLPSSGGANPNPEIPDSPCDVLDKAKVRQLFAQEVSYERKTDSCKITSADDLNFLAINVYSALSLTFEKTSEPGGRLSTMAGRPAYFEQQNRYIVISRSANPDDRGILTVYVGFVSSPSSGLQVATEVMKQVMPHYQY